LKTVLLADWNRHMAVLNSTGKIIGRTRMGEGVNRTTRWIADLSKPRMRLLGVTAIALGCIASPVRISVTFAQTSNQAPKTADEAKQKLETQKGELTAKEQRGRDLQKDMTGIVDERRELNERLLDTAALVQKSEAEMTAIEERLAVFEKDEQQLRASLAKENSKISGILAALQRMGRNPPPVIITQRDDALEMVRSAMLLGIAFPGLRQEAAELTSKLNKLVAVMTKVREESSNLRAERERLTATQTQLASLLESKKQSLAERQAELKQVRDATTEIAKNVKGLSDLIAKLSRQTSAPPAAAPNAPAAEEDTVAVLPPSGAAPSPAPEATGGAVVRETAIDTSPVDLAPRREEEVAMLTPSDEQRKPPPSVVELAPSGAALTPGKPDRITPAVPFQLAMGKLPMPARGRQALGFGDKTQYGGKSKGIVLETRFGARVTSPCDGWVVYAGEFRSYGQLLIINAGGGYHVLIAGLSQMDVGPGQFVLASEPIGTMSGAPRTAQLSTGDTGAADQPKPGKPVLYIEFRKDGEPIDSNPWWVSSHEKVQQ
jgi:septal ring factor EnvC (AmiA/AmiB activator)